MAFRCSRQFKKAVVKYGLTTHRHILFPTDEKNRVRAKCSWPGCKWLIYGSKTSRSEWFKVVTFVDDHCCPPRRDNKLVTSPRIAKFYFNEIKDNPTWKLELIKKAVLNDMLVIGIVRTDDSFWFHVTFWCTAWKSGWQFMFWGLM